MLSSIQYGTFANYSPRGQSALSQKSRTICYSIKAGKLGVVESALPILRKDESAILSPFLDFDVILVPVPRSAPLAEGALWPAKVIADALIENGFGAHVSPCIERIAAVQKSSTSSSGRRPLYTEHYESLAVREELIKPAQITLVDDVLTLGRTMFACALRLEESFPEAEIRAFAMMRTHGLVPDIEAIVDPSVGTISRARSYGMTARYP